MATGTSTTRPSETGATVGRRSRAHGFRLRGPSTVSWLVAALVTLLVLGPLLALVKGAFSSDSPGASDAHWTLSNWTALFTGAGGSVTAWDALHSVELALGSVVLAVVLGAAIAWLVVRTNIPGRRMLRRVFLLPLFYSVVLNVIGWIMLADDKSGYVNALWRAITGGSGYLVNIYSYIGMVWVLGLSFMPYALMLCASSFERGNGSLEEAAAVSGAGPLKRLRMVTLPMASPALLAAALFVFALAMEDFVTPTFLGTQIHFGTLAYQVYILNTGYPNNPEQSAVLAILIVLLTSVGLMMYRRLTRQEMKYVSIGGKGQSPRQMDLGKWRWAAFGGLVVVFIVTELAPFAAVILRAFMEARTTSLFSASFGFQNFGSLGSINFGQSLTDSIVLAVGSAVVCTCLAIVIGYLIVRRRSLGTAVADYMISIPLGVPGIVLGVGMLWAFAGTSIYLTLWILAFAYVIRFAVYGVRSVTTGLSQLDPVLEEAAFVSGASRFYTTMRITGPLLKSSLASGWLLVFLLVIQELSATVILYGPSTGTISIGIFNELNSGFYGQASALAVVLIGIITLMVVIFSRIFHIRVDAGVSQ